MRKLASIREINAIYPIDGRDRIVQAVIDGWSLIVKKDEFQVGDKCVYIEIDSVLPEKEEFEFLRSKDFRIKTMKMAGVISQGICFPLSILPQGEYNVGDDVTDIIGVKQYEPTMDIEREQISAKNVKKGKYPHFLMKMKWFRNIVLHKNKKEARGFPSFISKTDETRIQNMPFILNDKHTKWVATEKIDGQSGTFALLRHKSKIPFVKDKFEYIVCSRNVRLYQEDNSSYWAVSKKYDIKSKLMEAIGNQEYVAIQVQSLLVSLYSYAILVICGTHF